MAEDKNEETTPEIEASETEEPEVVAHSAEQSGEDLPGLLSPLRSISK